MIYFLFFILGIIAGSIVEIVLFLLLLYFQVPLERTVRQVRSKLKPKGAILEDDNFVEQLREEFSEKHE